MNEIDIEDSVTIPIEDFNYLKDRAFKLECLECAGVDNWSGYCYAMRTYRGEDEDDDYEEEEF
jgi:hypothetical protein